MRTSVESERPEGPRRTRRRRRLLLLLQGRSCLCPRRWRWRRKEGSPASDSCLCGKQPFC